MNYSVFDSSTLKRLFRPLHHGFGSKVCCNTAKVTCSCNSAIMAAGAVELGGLTVGETVVVPVEELL